MLIIGASTRAAAFSALRAGLKPVCFDLFADQDLQQVADTKKIENFPEGLSETLKASPARRVMYVGGIENHPDVISAIQAGHSLWGNDQVTINNVRDQEKLEEIFRLARVQRPETHFADDPPLQDGTWLLKPINGCGGRGITVWNCEAQNHPTLCELHLFQKLIAGVSYSAVFISYDGPGDIRFVGITQQRIGEESSYAAPFQWCGNIGPVTLSVEVEHNVRRVGNILKWKAGLKGIFGVDFILDAEERVWVTEVNPRYPASTELLEHNTGLPLMSEHVRSFEPENVPISDWSHSHSNDMLGKAILYSPQDFNLKHAFLFNVDVTSFPILADIPPLDTFIKKGDPICTVFAQGNTVEACETALQLRLKETLELCLKPVEVV